MDSPVKPPDEGSDEYTDNADDSSELVQKLSAITPDELTPRQALDLLYELKSLL